MEDGMINAGKLMAWLEEHKDLGRAPYLAQNEKTRYVVDFVELRNCIREMGKHGQV